MRKEILGILLFFLVIFTLISLLSYHHADPSVHNAGATGSIHNLFGAIGAQVAGILVGLWGLGAFWVPILLLMASVHFFTNQSQYALVTIATGGMLLLIATGALLAFKQDYYELFGSKFSAGGIIGIPLKVLLIQYANRAGGAIILGLVWLIGFILATRFSLVGFYCRCQAVAIGIVERFKTANIKSRERRQKAKKRKRQLKVIAKVFERKIAAPLI